MNENINDKLLQEKINERIEESYQKDIFGKARRIFKRLRPIWMGDLINPSWIYSSETTSLNKILLEDKLGIYGDEKLIRYDFGERLFNDSDSNLKIKFTPNDLFYNYIEIKENDKIVYLAKKFKRILMIEEPKVEIYKPSEWENRLDYLDNFKNLKEVVSNYEKRLEEKLHKKEIFELKDKYSI